MKTEEFEIKRKSHILAMQNKMAIEIRAMRRVFEFIHEMTPEQRRTLIEDMKAIEVHKSGYYQKNSKEWDEIQQSYFKS